MTDKNDLRRELLSDDLVQRTIMGNEIHPFPLDEEALGALMSAFLSANLTMVFDSIRETAEEFRKANPVPADAEIVVPLSTLYKVFDMAEATVESNDYIPDFYVEEANKMLTVIHNEKHLNNMVKELTTGMGLLEVKTDTIQNLLNTLHKIGAKLTISHHPINE